MPYSGGELSWTDEGHGELARLHVSGSEADNDPRLCYSIKVSVGALL